MLFVRNIWLMAMRIFHTSANRREEYFSEQHNKVGLRTAGARISIDELLGSGQLIYASSSMMNLTSFYRHGKKVMMRVCDPTEFGAETLQKYPDSGYQ